jgi:uncharacterized protein YecT (DUF1311 family)
VLGCVFQVGIMKLWFFCAALWLGFASISAHGQDVKCKADGSTPEMAACASEEFVKADRALNVVYGKLLAKMQEIDKDNPKDARDKAVDRLRKSQRAWLAWRNEDCPLRSILNMGGTMERIEWPSCSAEMTRERSKQLSELLVDLQ